MNIFFVGKKQNFLFLFPLIYLSIVLSMQFNMLHGIAQMTIQLNYFTVTRSLFRGACLGVAWGLPGGFEGWSPCYPQATPKKVSPIPHHT